MQTPTLRLQLPKWRHAWLREHAGDELTAADVGFGGGAGTARRGGSTRGVRGAGGGGSGGAEDVLEQPQAHKDSTTVSAAKTRRMALQMSPQFVVSSKGPFCTRAAPALRASKQPPACARSKRLPRSGVARLQRGLETTGVAAAVVSAR